MDPICDQLADDLQCEEPFEQLYDLNELEHACFAVLAGCDRRLGVAAVADRVSRDYSTAYRALQKLVTVGLARRHQVTLDGGGSAYRYAATDATVVAAELDRRREAVYDELSTAVERFPDERPPPNAAGGD